MQTSASVFFFILFLKEKKKRVKSGPILTHFARLMLVFSSPMPWVHGSRPMAMMTVLYSPVISSPSCSAITFNFPGVPSSICQKKNIQLFYLLLAYYHK